MAQCGSATVMQGQEVTVPTRREARALGDPANVSKATIQLVKAGQRAPHYGTIRKLAAALEAATAGNAA